MGIAWSTLTLIQPSRPDGARVDFPKLPSNLSDRIEGGGRTLEAGLLVGEALGLEPSELTECLNEVWFAKHRGRGLFTDDHIPILLKGYTRIRNALRSAIDDQGRPSGPGGECLRNARSMEQHEDGTMTTRVRHVRLIELIGLLDQLIQFLSFARQHGLFMSDGFLEHLAENDSEK